MKKFFTLFFFIFIAVGLLTEITAQPAKSDFVIVGYVSDDPGMKQIQMRYQENPNAFFTVESPISGPEQVSSALEGLQIHDLHIFIKSNYQGIFLTGSPVTLGNADNFSGQFKKWKNSVSGKVFIHNKMAIASPELNELINKLEVMTGLEFELVK
jgi:hypothetical protein